MNRQRSTSSLFLLAFILATGCDITGTTIITKLGGPRLTGSGVLKSENRAVEPFHALKTSGAIKSTVTIGPKQSIEISAEDNILPVLRTDVKNGVLRIHIDHDGSISVTKPITVTIVTPSLDGIELDGACSAEAIGVESASFKIDIDGSSKVTIDGNFGRLDVEVGGASKLTVRGNCENLTADIDGASHLRSTELVTNDAKVETDGAASAHVNVTNELSADSDGASSIRYVGSPTNLQMKKSGAASIKPLEK